MGFLDNVQITQEPHLYQIAHTPHFKQCNKWPLFSNIWLIPFYCLFPPKYILEYFGELESEGNSP